MSEQRDVLHVPKMGGTETISIAKAKEIAANKEELTDAELEAKLIQVLERGIIIDRTTVDLPSDVYGEWVSDESAEIARMQLMGFEVDKTYAVDRSSHGDGTGEIAKIGDVIFMTCPKRVHDIIERVQKKRYEEANPTVGSQREEESFKTAMGKETNIPVIDEGSQSQVGDADIVSAVQAGLNK